MLFLLQTKKHPQDCFNSMLKFSQRVFFIYDSFDEQATA